MWGCLTQNKIDCHPRYAGISFVLVQTFERMRANKLSVEGSPVLTVLSAVFLTQEEALA